jgi:Mg2+/Co2+ transporter CorB
MVEAIDINSDIHVIYKKICTTPHTRIIVYQDKIDNVTGFIHVKDILSLDQNKFSSDNLRQIIRPLSYVSEFIPIIKQIHRAQKYKSRIFVVTNEYGDVLGIACLEDMFEMIFGDFTTESPQQKNLAIRTARNELIVDGTMLIRELNELYNLNITVNADALTVNGLVLKILDGIPGVGVCFRIDNLIFEVISVGDYWVERVKITFANI